MIAVKTPPHEECGLVLVNSTDNNKMQLLFLPALRSVGVAQFCWTALCLHTVPYPFNRWQQRAELHTAQAQRSALSTDLHRLFSHSAEVASGKIVPNFCQVRENDLD